MLRKTVYFRDQEDLDKFNALPNKAEWLHEHLNLVMQTDAQLIANGYSVHVEPTITEPEETA